MLQADHPQDSLYDHARLQWYQQDLQNDSDFEDAPTWRSLLQEDELNKLNRKETKRQDVLNGKDTVWSNWICLLTVDV